MIAPVSAYWKLRMFSYLVFTKLEGAVTSGMIHLGDKLGLYRAMKDAATPLRSSELAERTGSADLAAHHQNFLDCVRGKSKALNAGVMAGHRSAALVHLANIGARVGRVVRFDPQKEAIIGDDEAAAMVARRYREGHWATPKMS